MEKTDLPFDFSLKTPQIHESAYVCDGAKIVGDVRLAAESSVWYNSVLRADINFIAIGERSNIQDGTVIHLENDRPCIVGNDVTVGHRAILHGCTLEDGCLVGMGAIVLNGAVVKRGAMVAAGAVVKEGMVVPENTLVAGVPAKVVKTLDSSTFETHCKWAQKYVQLAQAHRKHYG